MFILSLKSSLGIFDSYGPTSFITKRSNNAFENQNKYAELISRILANFKHFMRTGAPSANIPKVDPLDVIKPKMDENCTNGNLGFTKSCTPVPHLFDLKQISSCRISLNL